MKRWYHRAFFLLALTVLTVSCRQLFTSSLGTSVARDGVSISSSTSLDDLLDITNGDAAADSDVAKELLDVYGDKDPADILALTPEEKASILNLAPDAAVDMDTLTTLAKHADDPEYDNNDLIEQAFDSFDSTVDLTVVETLLSDANTVATAPVDSLILASSVVLADVASEIGTGGSETVMDIMANPETLGSSGLTTEQQARVQTVIDAVAILDTRDETSDLAIGDFQLIDFLRGTQQ